MRRQYVVGLFLIAIAVALSGSGVSPSVVPQAAPSAFKQGNGAKFMIASTVAGAGLIEYSLVVQQ